MRRLLLSLCSLLLPSLGFATAIVPTLEHIDAIARRHGTAPAGNLADYAHAPSPAPERSESCAEAARRILAGTPTAKQSPDATAATLDTFAASAITAIDVEARLAGHLARFHAHRLIAAVHYNLFLRAQKLAELVAATYREKAAVTAFRELVATAAAAHHPALPAFRADLKKLEHSLQDLEAQCCPPDEATLREPTWQPALPLPPLPRKS